MSRHTHRWVAAVSFAVVTALLAPQSSHAQTRLSELVIDVPTEVEAGAEFVVSVKEVANERAATLFIDASYGPALLESDFVDGSARFVVPGIDVAGIARLDVSAGSVRQTLTLRVLPGAAADPLAVYVGPRTIVADGEDRSMVVVVPTDRFGNPTVDGTEVDITITRPDDSTDVERHRTDGLLAFSRLFSGTQVGRTYVAVSVGTASGPRRSVIEVAGLAEPFELEFEGPAPRADGATLFEVRTGRLVDVFGNQLPDGVVVTLDLRSPGHPLRRRVWAPIIDGHATFVVETPREPMRLDLVASTGGARSASLRLDVPAALTDVPVRIATVDGRWDVVIGRVVGLDGAYVPDGTIAELTIADTLVEIPLENGLGRVLVDQPSNTDAVDRVSVVVLGVSSDSVTWEQR